MSRNIPMLAIKILPWLVSYPTRFDFKIRQKLSSRIWQIFSGDAILRLYWPICLNHRPNRTTLWVSHSKSLSADLQHSNLLPWKCTLFFDDDASGVFSHMKLQPQELLAHACSIGQTLCNPIGSVFGTNVSLHNWEVLVQSRWKKRSTCSPLRTCLA